MCGLVTVVKRIDDGIATAPVVLDMFKKQITRGQQGFGYVAFDDTIRAYIRRQSKEEIEKALSLKSARSIMFHHRIPTSTPNLSDTTHPIKVSHKELKYDYYVEHNGIISNDSIMHDEHIELGYKYNTVVTTIIKTASDSFKSEEWNDSEAMAIDLARFIEGKQEEMQSRGSIAFVALQVNKKTNVVERVYFGHNAGNPLTMHYTENTLVLRSEGETEHVAENMMTCLQLSNWEMTEAEVKIGEYATVKNHYNGTYAGYPDKFPNYEDDDDAYGFVPKPNYTEEQIINEELDRQDGILEDKIQELLEIEIQLISDIEFYMQNGNQELVDQTRLEVSKNRELISKYEEQQAMLGADTIMTA